MLVIANKFILFIYSELEPLKGQMIHLIKRIK